MQKIRGTTSVLALAAALLLAPGSVIAQSETAAKEAKPSTLRGEIYGFAQADFIYDFNQVNPDWFDVLRTTKLPSYENEFGKDGHFWASVRQTRFGVKGWIPTGLGEIKTIFEFELFGVGADAGQTTIRLRHAWGELGAFGAGQGKSQ